MKINEIFENMSYTGTALKKAERKKGIQPGTPDWFKHWFELPYMKEDVSQGQLNALENNIPLRRVAQVSEVVKPILFLCSDDASYIHGACLDVNGGQL